MYWILFCHFIKHRINHVLKYTNTNFHKCLLYEIVNEVFRHLCFQMDSSRFSFTRGKCNNILIMLVFLQPVQLFLSSFELF
jgi:hypothetical protein